MSGKGIGMSQYDENEDENTERSPDDRLARDGDVVGVEVAVAEFDRFLESMDLVFDRDGMDVEDRKAFDENRRVVLRAILDGRMVIDPKGQPKFTPKSGKVLKPITFYEPTGNTLLATDGRKKGHDIARTHAAMAEMSREAPARFASMAQRDGKVVQALFVLFFG